MYQIIRCGSKFDPVVAVSPPDADIDDADAKYYARCTYGEKPRGVFVEISREAAIQYFSGIADGIGFEEPPPDIFPTLDDALQYVTGKQKEAWAKYLKDNGLTQEDVNRQNKEACREYLIEHGLDPDREWSGAELLEAFKNLERSQ